MTRDEFVIAIVMVVCLAVFYAFVIGLNTYQCKTKATIQELEWSYGPIQGCMVKQQNGKWIDYDHLRYTEK